MKKSVFNQLLKKGKFIDEDDCLSFHSKLLNYELDVYIDENNEMCVQECAILQNGKWKPIQLSLEQKEALKKMFDAELNRLHQEEIHNYQPNENDVHEAYLELMWEDRRLAQKYPSYKAS